MIKLDKKEIQVYTKNNKGLKNMDFDDKLKASLSALKNEAKNYMSDTQFYREIVKDFRNNNKNIFGKAVSLEIQQHPEFYNKHILKVSVLHPSMQIQSTRAIAAGTKEEILNALNDENLANELKTTIKAISENLEEK
jgi:hypothetical protein